MNKLSNFFKSINSGDSIVLEKNCIYDVSEDDSFILKNYFCSNTAKLHENPSGARKTAIYLKDKKDIVIDGNGAEILVHGKMTPILLDNCENITIKNLKIDYACPTMAEFKILSNDNGVCELLINAECRYEIEGNKLFWVGESGINSKPYWKNGVTDQGRYCKLYNPKTEKSLDFSRDSLDFVSIKEIEKNHLKVVLKNKDIFFPAGYIVQTRSIVRDQVGSFFERCKNLRFENLRIMFMHGLGMVSQFCENVTFSNCDLTPKDGRTIVSTADFFQFSGCRGEILIENCKARGAHDDYINVHGTHLRIVKACNTDNSLILRFMHPESWGFKAFEIGDTVDFIKWDTLIPYYSSTVIDYKKLNETDIYIKVNDTLPETEIGKDVLENATWTPSLSVRSCYFGPTSGRGILATTRGKVLIDNNYFDRLWGPALLIEDDCNFWFESGYTTDIVFKNNVVDGCEYAKMYPYATPVRCSPKVLTKEPKEFVHKKISIENNVFKNSAMPKHTFFFEHIENVVVKNNVFDAPLEIISDKVGTIETENNIIN